MNNGKNGVKQGINLPVIKSDKDGQVLDMKLKGYSNRAISAATGVKLRTVGNMLSKGGRLYPALQALRADKTTALAVENVSIWESLLAAKDPAIQELKRLALESGNDAVRLKAIDMIIEITGIRDDDEPPLLDPNGMEQSLERLAKWVNAKLVKTYQERAPKMLFDYGELSHDPQFNFTLADAQEMERIANKLETDRKLMEEKFKDYDKDAEVIL